MHKTILLSVHHRSTPSLYVYSAGISILYPILHIYHCHHCQVVTDDHTAQLPESAFLPTDHRLTNSPLPPGTIEKGTRSPDYGVYLVWGHKETIICSFFVYCYIYLCVYNEYGYSVLVNIFEVLRSSVYPRPQTQTGVVHRSRLTQCSKLDAKRQPSSLFSPSSAILIGSSCILICAF